MLTEFLSRIFVPDHNLPEKSTVRVAYGVFSGFAGVSINVFLFAVKLTVGIISGSVAIIADAVNNLSDAGSGVVTILGFKLAAKPADSEHPFGHGRSELCCGVIVAVIIMMMGLDLLKESIGKIITPTEIKMSPLLFCLVAGSLIFKLWLFFFYRHIGKKIDSGTIRAAAFDSLSDIAGTSVVLLAVWLGKYTSFPVDGTAGALVAVLVLIGGGKVLRDTISPLLGEPPNSELVEELQRRLLQCEGIKGVHDIIMHNYGPNQYFATAHAEVDLKDDLLSVHDMLESAEVEIGKTMPVHLLLHCDPYNPADPEAKEWRVRLEDVVAAFDPIFKVYDFRMKKEEEVIILSFHVLIPRNYHVAYAVIHERLSRDMENFSPHLKLKIDFIHSYI